VTGALSSPCVVVEGKSGVGKTRLVEELKSTVQVPTLVLHCRNEVAVPMEEGRRMATRIPGARFVVLEGRNHLIIEDEAAWPRFLEEVRSFLAIADSQ